jgi:hypothetical protein
MSVRACRQRPGVTRKVYRIGRQSSQDLTSFGLPEVIDSLEAISSNRGSEMLDVAQGNGKEKKVDLQGIQNDRRMFVNGAKTKMCSEPYLR